MRRSLTLLAVAIGLGLTAMSLAQPPRPRVPPRQAKPLVVEELTNSAWRVSVRMDRADRTYANGDLVSISVTSDQDGYLYLFNVDSAGNIVVLFPNQYQSNNQIRGGVPVTVPSPNDATFRIRAVADSGATELVKALVTKDPLREMSQVESLARSPKKAKRWQPPQMTIAKFRRLSIEVCGGDPSTQGIDPGIANQNQEQGQVSPPPPPPTPQQCQETIQKERDRIQQSDPAQYQQKMQQWATGQVEIVILPGKDKPFQDDKPSQNFDKKPR